MWLTEPDAGVMNACVAAVYTDMQDTPQTVMRVVLFSKWHTEVCMWDFVGWVGWFGCLGHFGIVCVYTNALICDAVLDARHAIGAMQYQMLINKTAIAFGEMHRRPSDLACRCRRESSP